MNNIIARVETITPSIAKELLDNNNHNRKQRKANVRAIEDALRSGSWQVTGQTIIISKTNQLMDGQHRLQAVMNTGISMQHLVVRGVENDVFHTIDTGKPRQASDVLSIAGIPNHSAVATLIKKFQAYQDCDIVNSALLSNLEVLDMYEAAPDKYQEALTIGREYQIDNGWFSAGNWALLYLAFRQDNSIDVLEDIVYNRAIGYTETKLEELSKGGGSRFYNGQRFCAVFHHLARVKRGSDLDERFSTKHFITKTNPKEKAREIEYPHCCD